METKDLSEINTPKTDAEIFFSKQFGKKDGIRPEFVKASLAAMDNQHAGEKSAEIIIAPEIAKPSKDVADAIRTTVQPEIWAVRGWRSKGK